MRSSLTVFVGPGLAGAHAEALPTASTLRNCASVSPGALMVIAAAVVGDVQVAPPSVEVRIS